MDIVILLKRHLSVVLGLTRCQQIAFLTSQSMDRKLTFEKRFVLRSHIFICKRCNLFREQLEVIRQSLPREDSMTTASHVSLSPTVRDRIKKLLRDRTA